MTRLFSCLAFFFSILQAILAQTFDSATLSSPKSGETVTTISSLTNSATQTYFAFRSIGSTKYVGGIFSPPSYFAMSDLRKVTSTGTTSGTVTLAPFTLSEAATQEIVLLSAKQGGWSLSVTTTSYILDNFPAAASSTLMKAFTFKNMDTFIFGSSKGFSKARKTSAGKPNYGGVLATRIIGLNESTVYDSLKCRIKLNATGILYSVFLGSDLVLSDSSIRDGTYIEFTTDQKYLFKQKDYKLLTIFGSIELDVISTSFVDCETTSGTNIGVAVMDYYSIVSKAANSTTTKTVAASVTCIPGCTKCDKTTNCLDKTCLFDPSGPKCLNSATENCPASFPYAVDKTTMGDRCSGKIANQIMIRDYSFDNQFIIFGPMLNPIVALDNTLDQYVLIYAEIGTLLMSTKSFFPLNLPQKLVNQLVTSSNRVILRFSGYAYNPNFPYAPKSVINVRLGTQGTAITMLVRNLASTPLGNILNPSPASFTGFEFEATNQFAVKKNNTYIAQFHINRTSTANRLGFRIPTDIMLVFTDGVIQEVAVQNNILDYYPSLCTAAAPCFLHVAFTANADGLFQIDPSLLVSGESAPFSRPVIAVAVASDPICPIGASVKSNPKLCECTDGYFPNTVENVSCSACNTECKTCLGATNKNCSSCFAPFVLMGGACVCSDPGYVRKGTKCVIIGGPEDVDDGSSTDPNNGGSGNSGTNPDNGSDTGTDPDEGEEDDGTSPSDDNGETTSPGNSTNPDNGSGNNTTNPDNGGETGTNPETNSTNPDDSGNNTTNPDNGGGDNSTNPDNGSGNNSTNPSNGEDDNGSGGNTTNPDNGSGNNNGPDPNNGPGNNNTNPENGSGTNSTNPDNGEGDNSDNGDEDSGTDTGTNSTNPENGSGSNNSTNPGNGEDDNGSDPENDSGNNNGTNPDNGSGSNTTDPNNGEGSNPGNGEGGSGTNPDNGSGNNNTNPGNGEGGNDTDPENGSGTNSTNPDNGDGSSENNSTNPGNGESDGEGGSGTNPDNGSGNNSTNPGNGSENNNGTDPNSGSGNNNTNPDNGGGDSGTNPGTNSTNPGNGSGNNNGTDPNSGSGNNSTNPDNGEGGNDTDPENGSGTNSTNPDNGDGSSGNNSTNPGNGDGDNSDNGDEGNGTNPGTNSTNPGNGSENNNGTDPNSGSGNNNTNPENGSGTNSTNPDDGEGDDSDNEDEGNGTTPETNTTNPENGSGNNSTNPDNGEDSGTNPGSGSGSNNTDPNNGQEGSGNNPDNGSGNSGSNPGTGSGSNNTDPNNGSGNSEEGNGNSPNPDDGTNPEEGNNGGNSGNNGNHPGQDETDDDIETGHEDDGLSSGGNGNNNGGDSRSVLDGAFDRDLANSLQSTWIRILYLLFFGITLIISFLSLKKYKSKVQPSKYQTSSNSEPSSKISLKLNANSLINIFLNYSPLFFIFNQKLQAKDKAFCIFHAMIIINCKLFIGALMARAFTSSESLIDAEHVQHNFGPIIASEIAITTILTFIYSSIFRCFQKHPMKMVGIITVCSIGMVIGIERIALDKLQNGAGAILIGYFIASLLIDYVVIDAILAILTKNLTLIKRIRQQNLFKTNEGKQAISVASLQSIETMNNLQPETNRVFKSYNVNSTVPVNAGSIVLE